MRVCIANLLLFISLYMLLPIAPLEMSEQLGITIAQSGIMFLIGTLGMIIVGPFSAYLIDAYKRKNVCIYSFLGMLITIGGYLVIDTYTQLLILCLIQGMFAGIGTIAGVTIAIDMTHTSLRSYGNVTFSWMVRLGMLIGLSLGVWIYQWHSFQLLLLVSVSTGLLGILFLSRVYLPFRAPMATSIFSTDRFLLVRGIIPAINLMSIAFVPGLLLPVFHHSTGGVFIAGYDIPFFAFVVIGFPLALVFYRFVFKKDKLFLAVFCGLILLLLSMILLPSAPGMLPPVMLGLGLGLVAPEFLMIFVKLSEHCQRGTANTTHFLSWQIGITSGIAVACYFQNGAHPEEIVSWGRIAATVSLLYFIAVTYPYFKQRKTR